MESPPSLRVGLLDLPVEIFPSIFLSSSTQDLHRWCLVCKTLNHLAEPFLYRRIHWTWSLSQTPSIVLLLRSILSRPELAVYIQSLVIDGDDARQYWGHRGMAGPQSSYIPIVMTQLEELVALIFRLNVHHNDNLIGGMRGKKLEAFVAFLLLQLPNLKYLRLEHNVVKGIRSIGEVLRLAILQPVDSRSSCLQHLEKVSFHKDFSRCAGPSLGPDDSNSLSLFYLPKIKHLSLSIKGKGAPTWPMEQKPSSSTLTSLHLNFAREGFLGHILSATPKLQTLHWDWHYRKGGCGPFTKFDLPIIDFGLIIKDLSQVRKTLINLCISGSIYMNDSDFGPPTLTTNGSFGAIVGFISLRTFKVPIEFLTGFSPAMASRLEQVLPKNIELLTLTDDLAPEPEAFDYQVLWHALGSWLEHSEHWRMSITHLRRIQMLLRRVYCEIDTETIVELKKFGEMAGVEIEVVDLDSLG